MAKRKPLPDDSKTSEKFIPSEAQIELVQRLKALNWYEDNIRRLIINPATRKKIAMDTFREAFAEYLKDAKAEINSKCVSVLFEALNATKHISVGYGETLEVKEVPDHFMRVVAVDKITKLASKGIYEPKFKVPAGVTPKEELDLISQALRDGVISTFEADSLTKVAQAKIEAEKEVERNTGITVNIDGETVGQLGGIVKDIAATN